MVHQPVDGGVARHVSDLYEGLQGMGYEVSLCGPSFPSASTAGDSACADAEHVTLRLGRAVSPRQDAAALARYARIVRALRPDLIHAHSSKAGGIARLGKIANPRVPVLYTPHGYAFAGYFEHEAERFAYRQAERAMSGLTRFVIAVCAAEGRLAESVCPPGRVRVVHNGIDQAPSGTADPDVLGLAKQGPVVVAVTQLRPGKGVETLVEAAPVVLARHPTAKLAIIGDGPLRDSLRDRARALKVDHAVRFLGEHADPAAVLRSATVFVLPSWAEAFPYVILEAMSAGLPVVSTDVGGISEAITHGESGLLVPPRDHEAIAGALSALLDDASLRERIATAAHQVVARRFTRAAMVQGVQDIYEEALVRVRTSDVG